MQDISPFIKRKTLHQFGYNTMMKTYRNSQEGGPLLQSLPIASPRFISIIDYKFKNLTFDFTQCKIWSRQSGFSYIKTRFFLGLLLQGIGSPWQLYGLDRLSASLTQSKIILLWMCQASLIMSVISSSVSISYVLLSNKFCFLICSKAS